VQYPKSGRWAECPYQYEADRPEEEWTTELCMDCIDKIKPKALNVRHPECLICSYEQLCETHLHELREEKGVCKYCGEDDPTLGCLMPKADWLTVKV
jgi:hypothetical protein